MIVEGKEMEQTVGEEVEGRVEIGAERRVGVEVMLNWLLITIPCGRLIASHWWRKLQK